MIFSPKKSIQIISNQFQPKDFFQRYFLWLIQVGIRFSLILDLFYVLDNRGHHYDWTLSSTSLTPFQIEIINSVINIGDVTLNVYHSELTRTTIQLVSDSICRINKDKIWDTHDSYKA